MNQLIVDVILMAPRMTPVATDNEQSHGKDKQKSQAPAKRISESPEGQGGLPIFRCRAFHPDKNPIPFVPLVRLTLNRGPRKVGCRVIDSRGRGLLIGGYD